MNPVSTARSPYHTSPLSLLMEMNLTAELLSGSTWPDRLVVNHTKLSSLQDACQQAIWQPTCNPWRSFRML